MASFATPIQFATAADAAPPIPGPGEGESLASLKSAGFVPRFVRIELAKNVGAGDVTLTGPVDVYGVNTRGTFKLATLAEGEDIVLGAAGLSEVLQFIGVYDSFEVVPVAVTADHSYNGWLVIVEVQ